MAVKDKTWCRDMLTFRVRNAQALFIQQPEISTAGAGPLLYL